MTTRRAKFDLTHVDQRLLAPQPRVTVLGVDYLHMKLRDGSDLYITNYGKDSVNQLLPHNHWTDLEWRNKNSQRLLGSSSVFRVKTKEIDGRSLDIVFKWNRMGQDIPGETAAAGALDGAEFNSPFMEFSLVHEMRRTRSNSLRRIRTHKPLAIYVPNRSHTPEQLGRRQERMEAIDRAHGEFGLDWSRTYAVIYEWLEGVDVANAYGKGLIDREEMIALYERSNEELRSNGYIIRDNKPRHVIVQPENSHLRLDDEGQVRYGLVDFELLERTPERERIVRAARRRDYLSRQVHRFEVSETLPPNLALVHIMGVDYVYGPVESTGGALWVVGRDPMLFDYFLPEKWRRTPRIKLDETQRWYKTVTKDDIHAVWRESRVGQVPEADPYLRHERRALAHGFNSPFEEFSIALELMQKGVDTKYPRAIYMTAPRADRVPPDTRRYDSHAYLKTPIGTPILQPNHEYMTIWGFWNGPDDMLAERDEVVFRGVDALTAFHEGHLTEEEYMRVLQTTNKRLLDAGVEDLNLCGTHLLLSFDNHQQLARDEEGLPLVRIRNFELLRRIGRP